MYIYNIKFFIISMCYRLFTEFYFIVLIEFLFWPSLLLFKLKHCYDYLINLFFYCILYCQNTAKLFLIFCIIYCSSQRTAKLATVLMFYVILSCVNLKLNNAA